MLKIFVFTPKSHTDRIIDDMASAGAGTIGSYTHSCFITSGQGNWYSGAGSHPAVGSVGQMSREPEDRVEMLCPDDRLDEVVKAVKAMHPYEEPEIDIVRLVEG